MEIAYDKTRKCIIPQNDTIKDSEIGKVQKRNFKTPSICNTAYHRIILTDI